MPDNTMPSRAANMKKGEGDRSTAERWADPFPHGERVVENSVDDDVVARENSRRGETPRRYDEELERKDTVMPSNDSILKTRI